ncbi:MAG TPA: hypothetical protein VFQ23_22520, partial [Anaerolineales bacterium]|nr:hypothetical protein [Anaerolineales bacterium]
MAHLRAGRSNQALNAYQHGLDFTDALNELDDSIEDLEKLKFKKPDLDGLEEILLMLKNWKPTK